MKPDEYRRLAEELKRRLAADPRAAALARDLERALRFELEHGVPPGEQLSAALRPPAVPAARRMALVSDIHGNHDGLLAVLEDLEKQRCDGIVCLGDLVEGGPGNEEVIETLRRRGIPCVRGNHDETNDLALSAGAREYLCALPQRLAQDDVLYVHISPRAINRKIDHTVEAWNVFEETPYRLVFVGHVHIPYVFGRRSSAYGEATRHAFEYNVPFALDAQDSYIVSVGSAGYGRDRLGKIRYAIYDREAQTVELRAIEGPVLPLDYALRGFQ